MYQVNSGFLRKGIPKNSRRQGNLRVGGFKAAHITNIYTFPQMNSSLGLKEPDAGQLGLAGEHVSNIVSFFQEEDGQPWSETQG